MKTSGACFMRKMIILSLLLAVAVLSAKSLTISTVNELYAAIKGAEKDLVITLRPGSYDLTPTAVTDSTLGNALNPDSMITVTTGLHLVGKNIKLIGTDRRKTIIRTHAGYGIFIEHCPEVLVKDLTITDGTRDQDGNATCGAIVVKHSKTDITGCIIENNQDDFSKTVAGIIGIVGREGSNLDIHQNIIRDNSWDGIALYRKAKADIQDNLIFDGRGAGIGITWDSEATAYRNVIHHYWKGIGSFGTSRATVYNNLVRDVRGWGIIASGQSKMFCRFNEVRRIGNVGIAQWDKDVDMYIQYNVISQCGQEKQWVAPLVGIWINNLDSLYQAIIEFNLFWDNKQADIAYGYKEPGVDGSDFTFDYSCQLFNNYKVHPTNVFSERNYYKKEVKDFVYLEVEELDVGIFSNTYQDKLRIWTWDPDKEPFKD